MRTELEASVPKGTVCVGVVEQVRRYEKYSGLTIDVRAAMVGIPTPSKSVSTVDIDAEYQPTKGDWVRVLLQLNTRDVAVFPADLTTAPRLVEEKLTEKLLMCEGEGDEHAATLLASNGGLYCEVHQPVHTGVIVPNGLMHYAVYDKPLDYPNGYVIRRYVITESGTQPTREVYTADTDEILDNIREEFRRCGLTVIPRMKNDHPSVVEVWM